MRAALAHLLERADGRRTVAILGEMAELGPEAAALPRGDRARGGARRRRARRRRARPALRPRRVGGHGGRGGRRSPAASCGRATRSSSRARARSGSRSSPTRSAGSRARDPRPHRRRRRDSPSRSLVGPRFIDFLRRNEFGQHIREEGPQHHFVKQGTPTMGGLLILFAATVAFLPVSHYPTPVADRALHGARVRCDRLPRRLHQADAQAVARPVRPLEAPAARGRHGRRRDRGATTST